MNRPTANQLEEARRPIGSLIGKSAKALRKLSPGTWQHRMLRDNLKALRIVSALMDGSADGACEAGREELLKTLAALASIISRAEKSQASFPPGTSQHSLQRNRLKALRVGKALAKAELAKRAG